MKPAKEFGPVDTVIIDCFYVAYRGFCSTPPLQSSSGMPTNAIHGILGAVRRMVKELQPRSVIVATEGGSNLRDQMSADYKAGRELPDMFARQVPLIHEMCRLAGWHLIERAGYEADDVIATVCRRMRELQLKGAIFSTDKDVISRMDDRVLIFKTEAGKSYVMEPSDYQAKWGVPPALIPEVLCLCGDGVDNISGVQGVGKKTATRLIQEFGSVEGVYQGLDRVQPMKLRLMLSSPEARQAVESSRQLIRLNENLPLDDSVFQPGQQQTDELRQFFLNLDMVKTAEGLTKPPPSPSPAKGSAPVRPMQAELTLSEVPPPVETKPQPLEIEPPVPAAGIQMAANINLQ
jgi:DNA polymerase I